MTLDPKFAKTGLGLEVAKTGETTSGNNWYNTIVLLKIANTGLGLYRSCQNWWNH